MGVGVRDGTVSTDGLIPQCPVPGSAGQVLMKCKKKKKVLLKKNESMYVSFCVLLFLVSISISF